MQGYVHHGSGLVKDALDLVTHRALEPGTGERPQPVEEFGHPVNVSTAAPLVDGHDVHESTLGGSTSNINHFQLIV
jgi:hypothetical protein